MKNRCFYFLFALLFLPDVACGQSYNPMAVEGAHWIVERKFSGFPPAIDTVCYRIKGDTIINNIIYKKIEESSVSLFSPNIYITKSAYLLGLLRDDTIAHKVYMINIGTNKCYLDNDHLLYDFSLGFGDTIDFCHLLFTDTVDSVSQDTYWNYPRRTLYSSDINFIESIGTLEGVFDNIDNIIQNYTTLFYCLGSDSACGIIEQVYSGLEDELFGRVTIYPNPTTDKLYLETSDHFSGNIRLVDGIGRGVLFKSFNGRSLTLDFSGFNPGIYFLHIRDEDSSKSLNKKIMITNR